MHIEEIYYVHKTVNIVQLHMKSLVLSIKFILLCINFIFLETLKNAQKYADKIRKI